MSRYLTNWLKMVPKGLSSGRIARNDKQWRHSKQAEMLFHCAYTWKTHQ